MIAENQIREKLGRYLRQELSLDQFEDWIAQQSWNMHKDSSESAQKLASAIELRLAEHSNGHLDEPILREELRQFANPPVVRISFGEAARQSLVVAEQSNYVTMSATPLVFSFTSRVAPPPAGGPFLAGVVSADREQLVGRE
ncbi:MAG: hypothetical protein WCC37_25345 [Candidatus Sulfotelmatobacter sp.]|jgi:hypothetical protein